ncbi:hypothetical protein PM082_013907 [Marasmius tenuissimus]|nr:hypothetical protein PM082_013907 [Marasmius tenuissimus]
MFSVFNRELQGARCRPLHPQITIYSNEKLWGNVPEWLKGQTYTHPGKFDRDPWSTAPYKDSTKQIKLIQTRLVYSIPAAWNRNKHSDETGDVTAIVMALNHIGVLGYAGVYPRLQCAKTGNQ